MTGAGGTDSKARGLSRGNAATATFPGSGRTKAVSGSRFATSPRRRSIRGGTRSGSVGTIASAYHTLGMELGGEARRAMREYMVQKRLRPGARHLHGAEGFGLDPHAIRDRFSSYCRRFDL